MAVKVLFCFYPLFVAYNAGVALLSALCKEHGIETDLCLLSDATEFRDKVSCCDYTAFSTVSEADHRKALPFMLMAHEMGKPVLLGGPWAQLGKPCGYADLVCRGDGEWLPSMLRGQTIPSDRFYADLDTLPLPDYELFEGIPFERGLPGVSGDKVLPYITSRGCPCWCKFCQVHQVKAPARVRCRVGEDLSILLDRYKPQAVYFMDALLPFWDQKWRESWGGLTVPFFAYIRADATIDELEWLIDRGMTWCAFGVESGNEVFRNDVLNKFIYDDEIHATVETLRKHGVQYSPFFMTGYPGETFAMLTESVVMSEELGGSPLFFNYVSLEG